MILTYFRKQSITADFYLISESLQFLLQVIFPFLYRSSDEIFRTEFLILASIFQYMPYWFQDRVSYCYQSSFLASAGCQPVITCAVKIFLVWVATQAASVITAFNCLLPRVVLPLFFTGTLVISRTHPGPWCQMLFRGEGFHVDTELGYQVFNPLSAKSGDFLQKFYHILVRRKNVLNVRFRSAIMASVCSISFRMVCNI